MSEICTWTGIGAVFDRTGFGLKRTWLMISRAGSDTLEIGIETFPFGSLICPAGPVGCAVITPVGTDVRLADPTLFLAVTTTLSV